ncbi:MAG TPA: carbohydrate ABC transporter permease [Candidatus Omnitrophota bacterium]|nr:carbohydrate ABC transporter permease [Candidatus Omnitrophota bacterium]HPD84643.1 carbohydrate ABC transporter permease [Candidatus Omnitrophota bacterium]HRZ03501.1 carbohydrate ABC transporter permease [Candidatus Omnitrophota bacterium]
MNLLYYRALKVLGGVGAHAFLIATAVTCLFPLFWMFRSSLMSLDTIFTDKSLIPSALHFGNYAKAWVDGGFGIYLLNSIFYTGTVVGGIVVVASLAAFAFSRLSFPGKNFFFYMFIAAMMIPLPGSFVPLVVLVNKLGLADTRIGYILCMINVGLSMSIFLLKTFFDKLPSDLEDVARIEGCNKLGIWWHVALPWARPAIAVVVIFNSLIVWNEYILAQLLLNDKDLMPLQIGLMKFQGAHSVDYPVLMAGLTIAALPIIFIYLLMQKHIMRGFTYGATGG